MKAFLSYCYISFQNVYCLKSSFIYQYLCCPAAFRFSKPWTLISTRTDIHSHWLWGLSRQYRECMSVAYCMHLHLTVEINGSQKKKTIPLNAWTVCVVHAAALVSNPASRRIMTRGAQLLFCELGGILPSFAIKHTHVHSRAWRPAACRPCPLTCCDTDQNTSQLLFEGKNKICRNQRQ